MHRRLAGQRQELDGGDIAVVAPLYFVVKRVFAERVGRGIVAADFKRLRRVPE